MKNKNLLRPFLLLLGVMLFIVVGGIFFIRPYIPHTDGALSPFEAPPLPTDARWRQIPIVRPSVPHSATPITIENVSELRESARWGSGTPRALAYSPDGTMIALGTALGADLYHAETLEPLRRIETTQDIQAMAFSPNGTILALALYDHSIDLYAVADGSLLRTLEGHRSFIQQLEFDSTGTRLGSASWDDTVRIWSVADGELLQTIEGHEDMIEGFAYHPDGTMIATASYDGTMRLWRIEDGAELKSTGKPFLLSFNHAISDISAGGYNYYSVAFSPDGQKLAATDSTGYTYIWEIPSGRLLHALENQNENVRFFPVRFTSNTTLITMGGEQWDFAQGEISHAFNKSTFDLRYLVPSPKGDHFAAMNWEGTLGIWSLADGSFVKGVRSAEPDSFRYSSVLFAPDGTHLFLGNNNGEVEIHALPEGTLLQRLPHGDSPVESLALSPDGTLLATGTSYYVSSSDPEQGRVRVWEVESGALKYELRGHDWIKDLQFSPDGHLLATAGADDDQTNPIRLWDMTDGSLVRELIGHDRAVEQIRFTNDGNSLRSVAYRNQILEWDVATGKSVAISDPLTYNNYSVFSADGTLFAARTLDETVAVLNLTERGNSYMLDHGEAHIWTIAFNADRTLLATGTQSGSFYIWNLEDGTLLQQIPAHNDILPTLAFTPDGTMLVTAGWDNTLRFWQVDAP